MGPVNNQSRHNWLSLLLLFACVYNVPVKAGTGHFESDHYHFTIAEQPAWVEATPLPENVSAIRGVPTRYLLSEWQTLLADEDNQTTQFTRIVYSPQTGSGIQDAAEISVDFHPDYEGLMLHYVRLKRDGKVVDRLRANQVRLIQHERDMDKHLYNGEVTAQFVLDDVRVGDVIDYAYSIKGRNPVFSGKYFNAYALGWQVPVDRVAIRIIASADRHLQSRSYNVDLPATERLDNGRRIYSWRLDGTKPLRGEDEIPDWYDPYPWLQISEYQSWREVSDWADSLYADHDTLSGALRQKIRTWVSDNGADSDVAIQQALAFVQDNIRYFGVEMGVNSHMPSQPRDTFSRRYGDCKDKAVLLSAILNEMGYRAHPALVSMAHNRAIAAWLPSPGDFDHVIVRADIKDRIYWIDATRTLQRGRLEQRGQPDFGQALIVGVGSRNLSTIDRPDGYLPTIDIEELYIAHDYTGPVELVVTSRFTHGEAEARRRLFLNESLDTIQENYLNYYARIYPGIDVAAPLAYEDDQKNNLFTVTERYQIADYWEHRDGRLYSNFYGSSIVDYTRLPNIINRKMPLALSYPLHVHHSSVLQFPEDVGFGKAALDENFADADMSFVVKSAYENKRLSIDYIYDSLADAVMPEDMRKHLSLRRQINDNLSFSAWIADAASLPQQAAYTPPHDAMSHTGNVIMAEPSK